MMNYEKLGKTIAKVRTRKGLTQETLAERIDVSAVFISQIETAARKPSLETIYKLALQLAVPIDSLIEPPAESGRHTELDALLKARTDKEIQFITNVVREICTGIEDKIVHL